MTYTRQIILGKCEAALANIANFYQQGFVNYRGLTFDTKELYTEVVAEFVLDNASVFETSIPRISRQSIYNSDSRSGVFAQSSNRIEEITAMKMFNDCKDGSQYDHIGKIIDYQTPLKSKQSDSAGKIDLLAYDGGVLRMLELKRPDSKETMLRCVLEGYTYLKTVDNDKLVNNFELPDETLVQASPLVFHGGAQWKEMQEDRPWLNKLMTKFSSKPFYLINEQEKYRISEG